MSGLGIAYRMGDEFCVLGPVDWEDGAGALAWSTAAASEADDAFGAGCSVRRTRISGEPATAEDALELADQRTLHHGSAPSSPSDPRGVALLQTLPERSPDLLEHCGNVAELAEAVSREWGLSEVDVRWIGIAAELHDVGKLEMPDAILNKPGPLSDEEWGLMRRHTVIGERIIRRDAALVPAAQLVRSTHERYDGQGYPDGLAAHETAIGASIIAICDAYDAMVNDRVYRESRSQEEALAELRRCAGTQFDPAVVELLCSTVERRDEGRVCSSSRDDHR